MAGDPHDRLPDPTKILDQIGEHISWAFEGGHSAMDIMDRFEWLVADIDGLDRHLREGFELPEQWRRKR